MTKRSDKRQSPFMRWMPSLRRSLTVAVVLVLAVISGVETVLAQTANPIKIGFSIPLTGGLASNGKAILATYQMWQDDINAKGGLLGRKVELATTMTRAIRLWCQEFTASCWTSIKSIWLLRATAPT